MAWNLGSNRGDESRPLALRIIVALVLLLNIAAMFLPAFMLPFVNVLPYLHAHRLLPRIACHLLFLSLTILLLYVASTQGQWRRAIIGAGIRGRRDAAGTLFALALMTVFGAYTSANTLGLLVKVFPGADYSDRFEIVAAERLGSKYKSVVLDLKSLQTSEMRYLTLSKNLFDYPAFEPGMMVLLEGKENWFGVYVENYMIVDNQR